MNISLEGKIALVCGSTQGIGLATAKELATNGATCILLARNESMLKEVVADLPTPLQQKHLYAVADFTDIVVLRSVISNLVKSHTIHILVNNTGGPKSGPITEAVEEDFEKAFQQHVVGNQVLTKAVIPGMKAAGYGRIINIVSTSVRIPIANLGVSNTIRAAVAGWAKTMANELGQFSITVNNILPGFIDTARLKSLIAVNADRRQVSQEAITKGMIAEIPAGRFGLASEIAAAAAFLASPAASYINGVNLPIDGGKTGSF